MGILGYDDVSLDKLQEIGKVLFSAKPAEPDNFQVVIFTKLGWVQVTANGAQVVEEPSRDNIWFDLDDVFAAALGS